MKLNETGEIKMETEVKDYRVKLSVKNNRIMRALESQGVDSLPKWCKENNVSYHGISMLINLKSSPITKHGRLTGCAKSICDALCLLPDDLWSVYQLQPLEKNYSEIQLDRDQIAVIMGDEEVGYDLPEDHGDIKKIVESVLDGLPKKEKDVIKLRFWDEKSLDEISDHFNVTRERVRQIELKALGRMRNSKNWVGL